MVVFGGCVTLLLFGLFMELFSIGNGHHNARARAGAFQQSENQLQILAGQFKFDPLRRN